MSDDGWTDWIPHDGSAVCPIPLADAGECSLRFGDGREIVSSCPARNWGWLAYAKQEFTITAYRVRSDLAHLLATKAVEEMARALEAIVDGACPTSNGNPFWREVDADLIANGAAAIAAYRAARKR